MIFSFKHAKRGIEIQYDSKWHILRHDNNEYFNSYVDVEAESSCNKQPIKAKTPKVLKIQLGQSCNMACSYCLQDPLGNKDFSKADVAPLLSQIQENLNLHQVERIELWGGEPLLYWNAILDLITHLDNESLVWSIVTNGTLLKDKHFEVFTSTKGRWNIAISHDGLNHQTLRGKDPFNIPASYEVIQKLAFYPEDRISLTLNCTISNTNWDVFSNLKFFTRLLPTVKVNFELLYAYDSVTKSHVLSSNIKNHKDSLFQVFSAYEKGDFLNPNSLVHFGLGYLPLLESFKVKNLEPDFYGCGMDKSYILSLDLKGNLLLCQNVSSDKSFGTLPKLSTSRMDEVIPFESKSKCENCPVKRLCKRSCPLSGEDVFETNCSARYAHYLQLLQLTIGFALRCFDNGMRLSVSDLDIRILD